jgi:hypothetical protein
MTTWTAYHLECDRCAEEFDDFKWSRSDIRKAAKEKGWITTLDFSDLCPTCADDDYILEQTDLAQREQEGRI